MNRDKTTTLRFFVFAWLFAGTLFSSVGAELDGVIEPSMSVALSSRIDGILESVDVDVGDVVTKRQVLAQLESQVEQAALAYASARASISSEVQLQQTSLAYGRRQLKRIQELHNKSLASFQDLDEIETETKLTRYRLSQAKENRYLAELDLAQAQAVKDRHSIRSPIDGIVVERFLNPGESVEDQPIVKIAQINPLRIEVVAPVTLLGTIKTGQLATVTPESPVGGEYQAEVKIVDPILDAASGTFRIRLEIPNDDYKLTSGLRCRVRFLEKMASRKPAPVAVKKEPTVVSRQLKREVSQVIPAQKVDQSESAKTVSSKKKQAERYLLVTNESLLPLRKAIRQASVFNKKGVEDTWVIAKGSLKGHISLGYFSSRRKVDRYQQQLTDLGIDTRIVER
ncbi:MAG: efflux RND transporter periplasmic adaptor subunit [Candidatus Thiodiazotropha sp. (ex Myrtea spinifera)]|nr:efflux RND transporter periplasmic adaptor subunit [Candidatus Thiodiazotropha sp. (ex Myrtea spinifera)]MCU7828863.1 efflux RND transporter periplasmic adaptor subunit [Candidatus Thiodiazotropha sp. (ex Myrtea sp. 'scaly one' KF741663)]